jgi:hypothetical protein
MGLVMRTHITIDPSLLPGDFVGLPDGDDAGLRRSEEIIEVGDCLGGVSGSVKCSVCLKEQQHTRAPENAILEE